MSKKPRMGSDPFQKKDPLGWIDDTQAEESRESAGRSSQPSNLGKPSKIGNPSPPHPSSNQSKPELPGPQSTPAHLGTPSGPPKGMTTSKGLRPGWTRATFIVKDDTVQQLKAIAYWDRKELKRVVEEAFLAYLHGKNVQPIPPDTGPSD